MDERELRANGIPPVMWEAAHGDPADWATARAQVALFGCLQGEEMERLWGDRVRESQSALARERGAAIWAIAEWRRDEIVALTARVRTLEAALRSAGGAEG